MTQKQAKLLRFIKNHIDDKGYSPSYSEMQEALNLTSKSEISRLVNALEEKGFIYRHPFRARSIELVDTLKLSQVIHCAALVVESAVEELNEAGNAVVRVEVPAKYLGALDLALTEAGYPRKAA